MEFAEELELLIRSRYPVLWVPTFEEERAEAEIAAVAAQVQPPRTVLCWDFVDGYTGNGAGKNNPLEALNYIRTQRADTPFLFVLRDFHEYLQDHSIRRMLRNLARSLRTERKTVIVLAPLLQIPQGLEEDITVVDFAYATYEQIEAELDRLLANVKVRLEPGSREALIKACQGLTMNRVRQVLAKAVARHGRLDESDIALVLEEKKQMVRRTEVLEFYAAQENMADIGGLDLLKEWLGKRTRAFSEEARRYGLRNPKGVLLVGIQGTGKSLSAKAVSQLWKFPLLRLDVGRLMGSLVGESEERTRRMIQLAEAMAPCVLWIDEIDKAFAGAGSGFQGDSGTSSRVFGTFLTWLNEKTSPVFVVATANNIDALAGNAPELLRKGRFDDLFFVSLPSQRERREIFQVHLRKVREHKLRDYDLDALAAATETFSGAEIEQTVLDAMQNAFAEGREFTTEDVLASAREIVPLARTAEDQIERLKQWAASGRARPASSDSRLARPGAAPPPWPPKGQPAGGIDVDLPTQ